MEETAILEEIGYRLHRLNRNRNIGLDLLPSLAPVPNIFVHLPRPSNTRGRQVCGFGAMGE